MPFDPARTPQTDRSLAIPTAFALLWSAQPASAQGLEGVPLHIHEPFFVLPHFVSATIMGLHWPSFSALVLLTVVLFVACHRKYAKARHKERIRILGVGRGDAFMLLDILVHAVWRGRSIHPERLKRALEFARDMTEMDYELDHIRLAALQADRLITPLSFSWMRSALRESDKRRILETVLAVMLESGALTKSDKAMLRTLTRALGIKRSKIGDLHLLVPA